jgi:hypothetical protein
MLRGPRSLCRYENSNEQTDGQSELSMGEGWPRDRSGNIHLHPLRLNVCRRIKGRHKRGRLHLEEKHSARANPDNLDARPYDLRSNRPSNFEENRGV